MVLIRTRLFGVETLIHDEGIEEAMEHLFEPVGRSVAKDPVPLRNIRKSVDAHGIECAVPGLYRAILAEQKVLNGKGLPAEELIIWGRNKVRANPGPKYVDPRPPDEFTEF